MSNKLIILFSFILIGISSGCKSTKIVANTMPDPTAESIQSFWKNQYKEDYFEARGKATLVMDGKNTNLALHLKMKKDSLLWAKVSMFGIGATVLITQDSFFMINTLNQEYMAYGNNYLYQYLGYKATLSQVQNLLIGNAVFKQNKYRYLPDIKQLNASDGVAVNHIVINEKNRIFRSLVTSQDTTQQAVIQYDAYQNLNNTLIPTLVDLLVQQKTKDLKVILNYQTMSNNIITSFPFSIPSGYRRK
ncbi:MAG: DUF4292 domain-containing protein [Bacteroidetes bacterium]|nr:DUF4292 domain-containing protein [Bacteroidota bacterium]